jgi:uncharacterized protein YjiS (DUF1127 family)
MPRLDAVSSAGVDRPFPLRSALGAIGAVLKAWKRRSRSRRELRRLIESDPHLLADVGLAKEQVERELTKQFW